MWANGLWIVFLHHNTAKSAQSIYFQHSPGIATNHTFCFATFSRILHVHLQNFVCHQSRHRYENIPFTHFITFTRVIDQIYPLTMFLSASLSSKFLSVTWAITDKKMQLKRISPYFNDKYLFISFQSVQCCSHTNPLKLVLHCVPN